VYNLSITQNFWVLFAVFCVFRSSCKFAVTRHLWKKLRFLLKHRIIRKNCLQRAVATYCSPGEYKNDFVRYQNDFGYLFCCRTGPDLPLILGIAGGAVAAVALTATVIGVVASSSASAAAAAAAAPAVAAPVAVSSRPPLTSRSSYIHPRFIPSQLYSRHGGGCGGCYHNNGYFGNDYCCPRADYYLPYYSNYRSRIEVYTDPWM